MLCRITSNALQMVQKKNPDYVLTIKHITEYDDMKMVTFGVNDSDAIMTIIFNCAFLNYACTSKFGTAIIVKN